MTTNINYKCPCCGNFTLTEERMFEICPICNWEDDNVQFDNPDFRGGANFLSLNEYRSLFSQGKNIQEVEEKARTEYLEKVKAEYASKIRVILQKRIDFGSSDYWTQENKMELINFVKENSFEFRRFRKETATEEENKILDESQINFENCKTVGKRKLNGDLF